VFTTQYSTEFKPQFHSPNKCVQTSDVYVNSPTGQEDAEEDSLRAAIQLLSGEEVRETMKEVYEKSGTEIVLSYRCKMCNGEIDF